MKNSGRLNCMTCLWTKMRSDNQPRLPLKRFTFVFLFVKVFRDDEQGSGYPEVVRPVKRFTATNLPRPREPREPRGPRTSLLLSCWRSSRCHLPVGSSGIISTPLPFLLLWCHLVILNHPTTPGPPSCHCGAIWTSSWIVSSAPGQIVLLQLGWPKFPLFWLTLLDN